MPRIKLKPVENYLFSTEIKVRITDLNDTPIALVENGMVCFDYQTRSSVSLLEAAQVIFGAEY